MRNEKGQFIKGYSASPATQFKKGEHWRKPQPFREKEYLEREYTEKKRSAADIAEEFGVVPQAVQFWLVKHGIPRRDTSETRAIKHWGLSGEKNGMFGKRGSEVPSWKGGCTPERQACYSSIEWAQASLAVWRRERGVCQRCGQKAKGRDGFCLHHIVSFAIEELRTDPDNLALFCRPCHLWVHSRKNINKDFIEERG